LKVWPKTRFNLMFTQVFKLYQGKDKENKRTP
jgi:hypothetical protein